MRSLNIKDLPDEKDVAQVNQVLGEINASIIAFRSTVKTTVSFFTYFPFF
jgi:hypothetical protein